MQKFSTCRIPVLLLLLSSFAVGQNSGVKTRHPLVVSNDFFASLNSTPKHTFSNKLSAATNAATHAQDPRIISLPNFTRSFTFGGTVFPYTMVGHDPTQNRPTAIPTTYIPMSFFFDEFVDQNGNNIVIDATAITPEIMSSPLFQATDLPNGNLQFEDAQMRAEFFPLLKDHSNFHVALDTPQTLIPVTIEVPVGSSVVAAAPNGNLVALIDIGFLVSQLNTLFQTEPITADTLPILLTRNAVYGDFKAGKPLDCCVGGFHSAFESNATANKIFVQIFAFSTSLDSDVAALIFGDPNVFADVNALSHELGETLNDPFGNNATPSYQLPGLPPGFCQANLEVGDNIENLSPDYTTITLNGFNYHPQTLSLLQWFEGVSPSDAFNGDYSFPDPTKLTAPFTPCPTGP
jgi:hypothetical protein